MKRIVFGLALLLGGCATTSTAMNISEKAKEIQGYTRTFCSFVPTISTILAIISKGATTSAGTIATDICAAVTTAPLADGPGKRVNPIVYGVKVKGSFVK